jgi:hypothetical protein
VVLSGGNVDPALFAAAITARNLWHAPAVESAGGL